LSLKHSYALLAPFYDLAIGRASAAVRAQNLKHLPMEGTLDVLINGIGTGLDLPFLPPHHRYVGIDLTAAMLGRAKARANVPRLSLVQGDCQALPFADHSFNHAVLHLILAVVPEPAACLKETARTLKPGGSVLILDKFLRPGQSAWLRRALSPLAGRIATRLDVVFEEVLAQVPELELISDEPVLARGWFRAIRLVRH
jgi:phosphatidylethanolamine/phosphatidyl-N-methylethanolamine N-methyltransferase